MRTSARWRSLTARSLAFLLVMSLGAPVLAGDVTAQDGGPSLEIVAPTAGETITSNEIEVQVEVSDFEVDCAQAGLPDEEGVGHIHVMVDGMTMAQLANFYCSDTFTISGAGLEPGPHTIIVDLATNTHLDMMETANEVEIDFQPENPQPLPDANDQGEPGVELVGPSDGATVPPVFTVEVSPVNFEPSAELEGKQNVPGYGHYHVFVDTPMGMMGEDMAGTPEGEMEMEGSPMAEGGMEMMSMAGMVAMPGTNTFELDLTAWGPGEHTIFIEPAQNDHTMFESFGHVEFTVVVSDEATPTT